MTTWTIMGIVCDVLIVLISSFAILQYFLLQAQKRRTAATIVYNQLKSFDEYIDTLKTIMDSNGNISDYHMSSLNSILDSNHWNENKHILIPKLSEDDIKIIENTYATIERLESARIRIIDTFKDSNTAKSFALQFQLSQMILNNQGQSIPQFAQNFRNLGEGFSVCLPHDLFKNMVNTYTNISGTVTFEKLRNMSYKIQK